MKRKTMFIIATVILAIGVIGIVIALLLVRTDSEGNFVFTKTETILNRGELEKLPKKAASTAYLDRLGKSVTPPTNSWISGLALQEKPLAVYPMPLSFQALDSSFQIGLPVVTSDAKTITGGHIAGVNATVDGATKFELSKFDKTVAQLSYKKNDSVLGKLTIAQGSPFVFYRANNESSLTISNAAGATSANNKVTYKKDNRTYVIAAYNKSELKVDESTIKVTVPQNGLVTFYSLPNNTKDTLAEVAGNELTSVKVTHEEQGTSSITKFDYRTDNNQPTAFTGMPYQSTEGGKTIGIKYQSIYGDMVVRRGNTFSSSTALVTPSNQLDLSKLSAEEKRLVMSDLQSDSQDIAIEAKDSYYAGKGLARIATLLDIAEQLDQKDISTQLQTALKREISARLGSEYFYYDTDLKGIAAQTAAFGSEDFNDHHFHYGYFIYAASILGKYDQEFVDKYKNQINLLVADIASYEAYSEFPLERNYDPYSGHSWAAGLSPFQDGNNQESSSEALNAWNGVALWADVINNGTLKKSAIWMLSNETATAAKAWRSVDASSSYISNYSQPVASLNFGGKRTYSTFFSDESNTKLGIQLIPMSPVMQTFKSDGDAIKNKLSRQDKPNDYNVALGDYMLMYLALSDKKAATEALDRQSSQFIDDGNSRTYLRAWIYSQQ